MAEIRPIDANSIHYTTVISLQGINMFADKASVDKMPTLDYAPVGRGQWEDGAFENSKRCTECGRYSSKIFTYREAVFDYLFCPYCGKNVGRRKLMSNDKKAETDLFSRCELCGTWCRLSELFFDNRLTNRHICVSCDAIIYDALHSRRRRLPNAGSDAL